jgi:integrase
MSLLKLRKEVKAFLKTVKAITMSEQIAVMAVALKNVNMLFFLLWEMGVSTGLRISDILTLKPSHVSSLGFSLTESKTGNVRSVKISLELFVALKAYIKLRRLKDDDYIFYSPKKGKRFPISRQWVHRVIARIARLSGLECIGTHSMRKIFACGLFASTGSVFAVQKELGHKYMGTTLIYLKDLLEENVKSKKN